MWTKLILAAASCWLPPMLAHAQDAKATIDAVAKAMGDVNTVQYSGSGAYFAFGQAYTPGTAWPRFGVKSWSRTVDYEMPAMRDEYTRADGDPTARGGGAPLPPNTKAMQAVSGNHAWNQVGQNPPAPALSTAIDRTYQLWMTPHGFIKTAARFNGTAETKIEAGKKVTTISIAVPQLLKMTGQVNDKNLVERVEAWTTSPVIGDVLIETTYADYKDFGGLQFPTKIEQKQGGFPTLELTVTEAKANAPLDLKVPDNVAAATVRVQADKVTDGVWYLTGGSHHSVLVEMKDHLVVIEGPQDNARATALITEIGKLVANKPLKYVVNTHKHFDHSGGLAAFVSEGVIVVTHETNKAFFEQSLAAPRTIWPDILARSGRKPIVEGVKDKHVMSDDARVIELHRIQGSNHDEGFIMVYLPKEKLLVEADAYTPAPPNTAPPVQHNPNHVNLYENIERLRLAVDHILPLHGRKVSFGEFQTWMGKRS